MMKRFPGRSIQVRPVSFFLTALLLACTFSAHAQDGVDLRVVRLSRIEGDVLVAHAGNDSWEQAVVNVPLQQGDTLETQSGLAEIEFESGATAYLAENSALQFTQLGFLAGGRATQLTLTQGTGNFYANLTRQDSFRVSTSTFDVAIPERSEFRVDAFKDGASLEVLQVNVTVTTSGGSTNLEKGQSVAIHQGDFQKLNIARLPSSDSFDEWVMSQSETIRSGTKNTLSYLPAPNYYGLSDLSIYGNWVSFPGYGFCWRPYSVGHNWTPYVNGVWRLDARLGWIWVSAEPWGWAPYHFGSWLLSPTAGWVWVPGGSAGLRHWEGSRVNWIKVGDRVGWVAISPRDRPGAPANAVEGVITRPPTASRSAAAANEIVAGKDLRAVSPAKPPSSDFAASTSLSRSGPVSATLSKSGTAPHSAASQGQAVSRSSAVNDGIVYDRATRTFINRDAPRTLTPPALTAPVTMPRSVAGSDMVRASSESSVARGLMKERLGGPDSINGQTNRVMLPPPYTVAGSATVPNSVARGVPTGAAPNVLPSAGAGQYRGGASIQTPLPPPFTSHAPTQPPLNPTAPPPIVSSAPIPVQPQNAPSPVTHSPARVNIPPAESSRSAGAAQRR